MKWAFPSRSWNLVVSMLNRIQVVQFDWLRHSNPSGLGDFNFLTISQSSGKIRNGEREKFGKLLRELQIFQFEFSRHFGLTHFWSWVNSTFSPLALWGNKNWPPSMKRKKWKNLQYIMCSMGCQWSSLNGQGTQILLSHPFLELDEFHFLTISPLGVIRIGLPVWKGKNWKICRTKKGSMGC